jgi:hypothetical protein
MKALVALITSMLVAYVLFYFGIAWGVYDWGGALQLGIWSWIGFVGPVMFGMVLWEGRPVRLFLVNAGYWLVALIVMSFVLLYTSSLFTVHGVNDMPATTATGAGTYSVSE